MSNILNVLRLAKKSITKNSKETVIWENSASIFTDPHYQKINIARLAHLSSLQLDLFGKTVLELGAGIGDHTLFYLYQNCKVLPVEGRAELANLIRNRFDIDVKHTDLERNILSLQDDVGYDIVHCYGLLYHLNNPKTFLETASKCGSMMLLETCVSSDFASDNINHVSEETINHTQALHGVGCRPRREWIWKTLKTLFPFVYCPLTQPSHVQFPLDWNQDFRLDQPKRAVFVASHHQIISNKLTDSLPTYYKKI